MIDEFSMLDEQIFESLAVRIVHSHWVSTGGVSISAPQALLNLLDHTRKGAEDPNADEFGDVHMLMFGDLKQCHGRQKR